MDISQVNVHTDQIANTVSSVVNMVTLLGNATISVQNVIDQDTLIRNVLKKIDAATVVGLVMLLHNVQAARMKVRSVTRRLENVSPISVQNIIEGHHHQN
jgi:hypothetical protein